MITIGTRFTLNDRLKFPGQEDTIYFIQTIENNRVTVAWEVSGERRFTYYPIEEVEECFTDGDWIKIPAEEINELPATMTAEEFNKKYESFLEKGHDGLEFDVPEATEYLDKKFEELTKLEDFSYAQIKVKFDYPRVYMVAANDHLISESREIEKDLKKILDEQQ